MKMTSKLIISIFIIASLAVYGLLGTGYFKERQGQAAIAASTANVTQELEQTPAPDADMPQKLVAAQANLAAAQSAFPGKPNSTQVINQILKLADACQVKAIPLTTREWAMEKTAKGYLVFHLSMSASGDLPRFLDFLSKLENGQFDTLVVESLNVSVTQKTGEEAAIPGQPLPITASLNVAIYARADSQ